MPAAVIRAKAAAPSMAIPNPSPPIVFVLLRLAVWLLLHLSAFDGPTCLLWPFNPSARGISFLSSTYCSTLSFGCTLPPISSASLGFETRNGPGVMVLEGENRVRADVFVGGIELGAPLFKGRNHKSHNV
mmetsp:Transcript_4207/g.15868  ORF Transcript_4207/g.15868 Transcript_4207/m.15868 type:complete len:130 (-) Transcript_4207:21-410(-)